MIRGLYPEQETPQSTIKHSRTKTRNDNKKQGRKEVIISFQINIVLVHLLLEDLSGLSREKMGQNLINIFGYRAFYDQLNVNSKL